MHTHTHIPAMKVISKNQPPAWFKNLTISTEILLAQKIQKSVELSGFYSCFLKMHKIRSNIMEGFHKAACMVTIYNFIYSHKNV